MEAVKEFKLGTLAVFAAGALIGITAFSRVLSYALAHFRNSTLALLTGFMLGSLNKVWPWKEKIVLAGDFVKETNILPNAFLAEAIVLALIGFFLVYFLEKLSQKK